MKWYEKLFAELKKWWAKQKPIIVKPDPDKPNESNGLTQFTYFDNPMCKGYGAVDFWHTLKAVDQAALVAKYGVDVYHIEYLSWGAARTSLDATNAKYKDLLLECRKRKVVLFVSVFNDNSHLSKYGNKPWFPTLDYLKSALTFIMNQGSEGVIVQPVAETQTDVGKRFESYAKGVLSSAGFRSCYNNGSRPSSAPAGWNYAAYHPINMATKVPSGTICVTDTGSILREMGGYEKFDAAKVKAYADTVLNGWKRPLILYGFLHTVLDEEAVKVLGSVGKPNTTPEPEKPVDNSVDPLKPDEPAQPTGDFDITKVRWCGKSYARTTLQDGIIKSASTNGSTMYTDFNRYSWPVKGVGEDGTPCDAICCFFYKQGDAIVGGKYDWWRKGGQGSKTMENVHDGYNGHSMPAKGTDAWAMIVSTDEKLRSNAVKVTWK